MAQAMEDEEKYAKPSKKEKAPKEKQVVASRWNWIGVLLFLYYVGAAVYYFYVRATRTLNMGYIGWALHWWHEALSRLWQAVSAESKLGT
jgi:hypothetical protein